MDRIDWNQLRAFLETAESGSLSAAARQLGLTQPTLSRQVASLEQALGVTLFERIRRSMVLTDAGVALLAHARAMGTAADHLRLAATAQAQGIEGTVCVAATGPIAAFLLPDTVRRLREQAPRVTVSLAVSDDVSDLRRREADIAIRHVRPDHPDLIGRWLRDATAGFYAARSWVALHGHPRSAADAARCAFVGHDRAGHYLERLRAHGLPLAAAHFSCHADDTLTHWSLVRSGLGIGPMMDDVATRVPDVVRVLDEVPPLRFPIWLVTHRELRTARRIRLVYDLLAQALGPAERG